MKFNVLFRASGRIDPISAHQPYFTRIIENGVLVVTAFMFTAVCGAAGKKHMGKKHKKFRNLDSETAKMIAIYIDRKRLMSKVEKEGVLLCQAFAELMEDKKLEGIKEGERKGDFRSSGICLRQEWRNLRS